MGGLGAGRRQSQGPQAGGLGAGRRRSRSSLAVGLWDDQTGGDLKVSQKAGQADGTTLEIGQKAGQVDRTSLECGGEGETLQKGGSERRRRNLQEASGKGRDQPSNRATELEVCDRRAEQEVSGARETGGC